MTYQEKETLKREILDQLLLEALPIEALAPATALIETDLFELDKGRHVSFGDLCTEIGRKVKTGLNAVDLAVYLKSNQYVTEPWIEEQGFLKSTDAYIADGTITIGGQSITPLVADSLKTLSFKEGVFTPCSYLPTEEKEICIPTKTSHLTNDSDYITIDTLKEELEKLFILEEDPNSPLGKRIKAKYGFYSDYYISARGINPNEGNAGAGGLDENQLAIYLSEHNYITTAALSGYAKLADIPSLTGYATESWVNQQNFVTESVLEQKGYMTKADFEEMFELEEDSDSPLGKRIKAKYGFYSNYYVSARGVNPNESGAVSGGLDETQLAQYLSDHGYLTSAGLSAYATQQWVEGKGYATQSSLTTAINTLNNTLTLEIDKKLDKSEFNEFKTKWESMFEKQPDVNEPKGYRIKALFGLYTDEWLSARGLNANAITGNVGLDWPDIEAQLTANGYAKLTDIPSAVDLTPYALKSELVTSAERTLWNQTASDLSAILGSDTNGVLDKWNEITAFLDTYTEADTLANLLSNKADVTALDGYLPLTGGTLTGNLTIGSGKSLIVGTGSINPHTGGGIEIWANGTSNLKVIMEGNTLYPFGTGMLGTPTNRWTGLFSGIFASTVNVSNKLTIGDCEITWDADNGGLRFSKGIYSEEFVSARGVNANGMGSGGTIVGSEQLAATLADYALKTWVQDNYQPKGSYVTSVAWGDVTGKPTWIGTSKPTYAFSELTSHPTTLAGYGITDAKIEGGVITLGGNTITPLTSLPAHSHSEYVTTNTAQTISAKKTFSAGLAINGGATENTSMPFFLGIDAFADGGSVHWLTASKVAAAIGALTSHQSLANYVTLDGAQTISGAKMFANSSTTFRHQVAHRSDTRGIIIYPDLRDKAGAIEILGANGAWAQPCMEFENNGDVTFRKKIIKDGGTSSQFLKADGSVDGTAYWHSGNDGSGSGLDADLLDGLHSTSFYQHRGNIAATTDWNDYGSYLGFWRTFPEIFGTEALHAPQGVYQYGLLVNLGTTTKAQLYFPHNNTGILTRISWDGSAGQWTQWNTIAYTSSNVASATKLQTTRTIWGQNFNGEGNVSGNMTGVGEVYATGWLRTYGARGWYNQDYAGGIYMEDSNWIRTYNSKPLLVQCGSDNTVGIGGHRLAAVFASDLHTSILLAVQGGSVAYGICANQDGNMYIGKRTNGTYRTTTGDTYLVTLNSTGMGIGNTNPAYKLHVAGDILANGWLRTSGDTGWYSNTYGGGWYMSDTAWIRTYGSKNIYQNAGILRTDGTLQVGDGGARFVVNTDGGVGIGTTTTFSDSVHFRKNIVLGVANFFFTSLNDGSGKGMYLAQDTDGSQPCLYVMGHENRSYKTTTAKFWYDGTFYVKTGIWSDGYVSARGQNTSDARLKTNIRDFDASAIIRQLSPKAFQWNAMARSRFKALDTDETQYGLIAQDTLKTAPWLVDEDMFGDGLMGVHYHKLIPVLAKATKELYEWKDLVELSISYKKAMGHEERIKALEAKVESLERENMNLKMQIERR